MRKGWPGTTAALCFCVAEGLVVSVLAFAAGGPVLLLVLAAGAVVTAGVFVTAGVLVTVGLSETVG